MIMTDAEDTRELRERLIALTRDLVLIPGTEKRPEDLRRARDWVGNHLEGIAGVEVNHFESAGVPSLLAKPPECVVPEVLLCGHLDVVHHDEPGVYQSELRGGRIWGPGTGDMKGIVAILLELFRELHRASPGLPLALALTGDEERGGEHGTRALIEDHGLRCALAVVPDGGELEQIVVEEKGILHLEIQAEGKSCHAARPWLGNNALELLRESLGRLQQQFPAAEDPEHWYSTCTVTRLGTPNLSFNRIPARASATLDIRFTAPLSSGDVLSRVRGCLVEGVSVEPVVRAEPSILSPDSAFLDSCEEILGRRPTPLREHGGSDARFFAAHGIPVIMTRPICGNLHARNEWIDVDSMLKFHQVYRHFLGRSLGVAQA